MAAEPLQTSVLSTTFLADELSCGPDHLQLAHSCPEQSSENLHDNHPFPSWWRI
jgi:hypothetical protein